LTVFIACCRQLLSDCGIGVTDTAAAAAAATDVAPAVNQHRVLIFCQLKSMLDIVEHDLLRYVHLSALYAHSIQCLLIGSRLEMIGRFSSVNRNTISCFLRMHHSFFSNMEFCFLNSKQESLAITRKPGSAAVIKFCRSL